MEIPRKFRGSKFFQGLVAAILKFDSAVAKKKGGGEILASLNDSPQLYLARYPRRAVYLGVHKRISRISRRSVLAPVCTSDVSPFCAHPSLPPRAIYGATGARYLVFRSSTTADVPQRCCSVFSRSFAGGACKLPNRNRSEKEIVAPPSFLFDTFGEIKAVESVCFARPDIPPLSTGNNTMRG